MSLYEVFSTFAACQELQDERKRGRMPDDEEFAEFEERMDAIAFNDPSVSLH